MRVEIPRQRLVADHLGIEPPRRHVARQPLRRARHLVAPPVVEGDGQVHLCVMRGQRLDHVHQSAQLRVEPKPVAYEPHARPLLQQRLRFGLDIAPEERHETRDLFLRPLPVLGRESKDRHVLDAQIRASGDDLANATRARTMTQQTRATPALRPSSVASHDDRNVAGAVRGNPVRHFVNLRMAPGAGRRPPHQPSGPRPRFPPRPTDRRHVALKPA